MARPSSSERWAGRPDDFPRLLGDIGGTNARFAWQQDAGAPLVDIAGYLGEDHPDIRGAIRQYLSDHHKPAPRSCAIGIANPVTGDLVRMTNHHWSFSIAELQRDLGVQRLVVINDFAALALSLPVLGESDLRRIGPARAATGDTLAVLGPGTGLGVAGLVRGPRGNTVITGEGGHVSLAADNAHEAAVIEWLRTRFGHASAERALSGPGLVNLYQALCCLAAVPPRDITPAELIEQARRHDDAQCEAALAMFFALLGNVAGNLALSLGARGGVYIGGGIVARLLPEIEASSFRERFVAKGRFRAYLDAIPTWVIHSPQSPALLGAAQALDEDAGSLQPAPP